MNGRTSAWLTIAIVTILALLVLALQPYSADWPGHAFARPARRYIDAAIRQDSVALLRRSTSLTPVAWALSAARNHPDSLLLWGRGAETWTGERRGDTTEVFLFPAGHGCAEEPIVFRFVGAGDEARVLGARSACLDPLDVHQPGDGRETAR